MLHGSTIQHLAMESSRPVPLSALENDAPVHTLENDAAAPRTPSPAPSSYSSLLAALTLAIVSPIKSSPDSSPSKPTLPPTLAASSKQSKLSFKSSTPLSSSGDPTSKQSKLSFKSSTPLQQELIQSKSSLANTLETPSCSFATATSPSSAESTGALADHLIEKTVESSSDEGVIEQEPIAKKPRRKRVKTSKNEVCCHIYSRGEKKNTQCTRFAVVNGVFCSQHNASIPKEKRWAETLAGSQVLPPRSLTLKKARINRLKPETKYFLYRPIPNAKFKHHVYVKTDTDVFKLKVPASIGIPDGKGFYLWRKWNNQVVWKRDY